MSVRKVTSATTVTKDGMTVLVPAGTVLHVAPGSALETAIGTGNLTTATMCDQGQGGPGTSNRG